MFVYPDEQIGIFEVQPPSWSEVQVSGSTPELSLVSLVESSLKQRLKEFGNTGGWKHVFQYVRPWMARTVADPQGYQPYLRTSDVLEEISRIIEAHLFGTVHHFICYLKHITTIVYSS